jgi:hypothetical protein
VPVCVRTRVFVNVRMCACKVLVCMNTCRRAQVAHCLCNCIRCWSTDTVAAAGVATASKRGSVDGIPSADTVNAGCMSFRMRTNRNALLALTQDRAPQLEDAAAVVVRGLTDTMYADGVSFDGVVAAIQSRELLSSVQEVVAGVARFVDVMRGAAKAQAQPSAQPSAQSSVSTASSTSGVDSPDTLWPTWRMRPSVARSARTLLASIMIDRFASEILTEGDDMTTTTHPDAAAMLQAKQVGVAVYAWHTRIVVYPGGGEISVCDTAVMF